MRIRYFLTCCALCAAFTAVSAQDREVIAGIPVNYDESKTGDYKATLPDPLVMLNGKPVGKGAGRTKKEAEQAAAKDALGALS